MINIKFVAYINGLLLMIIGAAMCLALPFSFLDSLNEAKAILLAALSTISSGGLLAYLCRGSNRSVGKREGFLIVSLGWIAISAFGMLPYLYSGVFTSFTDAFFESVSGLTTTGATVIPDIEALPKDILFWRSLSQWIGGMGIIVLTVAILPMLGVGGIELFVAEAPGPTSDKIHPRIKETAKRLWLIYCGFTIILAAILWAIEMDFFDALNHAMTTMATGGFSTKNASIAHFGAPVHYVIALFMFLSGTNYTIVYFALCGKFKRVWNSDEFRSYLLLVIFLVILVAAGILACTTTGFERAFRDALFQIVSVITTTGYVTADYTSWAPAISLLFFFLLFVGACAGSTSGGIKIIRHVVIFRNSYLELRRLLHPRALIRIKVDQKIVRPRVLTHILVFVMLYLVIFLIGSLVMAIILQDFNTPLISALGSVATSLGNVGPSVGDLGPVDNFSAIPNAGKWTLVLLMLFGRLELFTVLFLFSPLLWKGK